MSEEKELPTSIRELIDLIRQVVRDTFQELMDEHLDDYEHEEKKADLTERWGEDEDHGLGG